MSAAVASETGELLRELRALCERLPLPQPAWHPYVEQIVTCRADFEHALDLAAAHPEALQLVAALVDGDGEPSLDAGASPELAAAWQRLQALPLPSGRHPYLDDILRALEAHRLLLVALSRTTA